MIIPVGDQIKAVVKQIEGIMHPYDGLDLTPLSPDWEEWGKARVEGCKAVGIDPEAFDHKKGAIGFAFDPSTLHNVRSIFIYPVLEAIKELSPYYNDLEDKYLAHELEAVNVCLLHARLWSWAVEHCYSTAPVPLNVLLIDPRGGVWHTQLGDSIPENAVRIFVSQQTVISYLNSPFPGDCQVAKWDQEEVRLNLIHLSRMILPPHTPRHPKLQWFFEVEQDLHSKAIKRLAKG